ncbi:hypothetical protein MAM1_0017d01594 [Mucor ambiguus]|uniref:Uncharacterized protein n=1 Tax=Mucor ambiguus TaxID=91626 RepID=A0A0C9MJW8_9FUNG|nr:hypothetical protein MAM1_0017d01594 [Mucor ambiguus]
MAPNIQTTLLNQHQLNNSSTTNSLILDYLFYQSIQSRLQKAFTFDDQSEGTDKNVIESVIEDILSSTKKTKDKKVDAKFEQRLNLCQLTNLTIGRTHHVTFSAPVASRRIRDIDTTNNAFTNAFHPTFCRRHRQPECRQLRCLNAVGGPGLAEAIPAFLKTSANMLRSVLDSDDDVKPLTVAGQQVMGGGMPSRWYDLFLDLLTQAAIQSYMCDGKTGLETIYEIFSYGYVEDEDEEDMSMEDEDDEDEEDDEEDDDEEDDENNQIWNVKASDHHLLFPKTRTMFLFKLQVREREKEFIQIKDGYTLEKHFKELEKLYPLIYFERNMCDFIQMLLEDMDIPALDKCDVPDITSPIKSPEDLPEPQFISTIPSLYKYPGDGSLLMPEIPDIHEDDIPTPKISKKRTAYTAELMDRHDNYKHHC